MSDTFEARLRDSARAIETPPPPADLIDRVVAARASGKRALLPVDSDALPARAKTRYRGVTARLLLSAAIAAGVAAIAVVGLRGRRTTPLVLADDAPSSTGGFFVSTAFAEQTSNAPALPPLSGVDGTKLVPRRYDYQIQYVDSVGHVTVDGGGSANLAAASLDGFAVWRVELAAHQTEDGQPRTLRETLFVSRRDLSPLTRSVHVRPYRRFSSINITQRFAGDSVYGEMTTDGNTRRPIARRLPPQFGPFMSDAMAPLGLVGVPLSPTWSRGLSILGWAVVPMDVFYPLTLSVIGEERITTPAGSFDCWKLHVVAGRQRKVEWVRKSDGLGLRSDDEAPGPRGHRRYVLLNP